MSEIPAVVWVIGAVIVVVGLMVLYAKFTSGSKCNYVKEMERRNPASK